MNDQLRGLSEEMKEQITGVAVTEAYIEEPKTVDELAEEEIAWEE